MVNSINAGFLDNNELLKFGINDAEKRNIRIHSTAVIVNFESIRFGCNVRIDPFSVLSCSDLQIGSYVHISTGVGIFGTARIRIGNFCNVSAYSLIYSSNDDYSGKAMTGPLLPKYLTNVESSEVDIEAHVIVGARSVILPGSRLNEGAAIGAGSLIKGDIRPWVIAAGSPARTIRTRSQGCLEKEAQFRSEAANTFD